MSWEMELSEVHVQQEVELLEATRHGGGGEGRGGRERRALALQACCACKYSRKRCEANCSLALYFASGDGTTKFKLLN